MKRLFGKNGRYLKVSGIVFFAALYVLYLSGCGPSRSSVKEIQDFRKAGPIIEKGQVRQSSFSSEVYRITIGDVLEFQMPAVLKVASSDLAVLAEKNEPYYCRVKESGAIT